MCKCVCGLTEAEPGRVFELSGSTKNLPCTVGLFKNRFHRHRVFLYLAVAFSHE